MNDATAFAFVALVALVTAAIRAIGPVALGGRDLSDWFMRVIPLLAPALLAALVCTSAFADGQQLGIGPETAGVAAAGVILVRGGSVVAAVAVAALLTAVLRAL